MSAFAQSSVTITGLIDAGYSTVSAKNGTAAKTTQSGIGYSNNDTSRFQIRAVEDLGGGSRAGVTIETQLMPNPRSNFGNATTATAGNTLNYDLTAAGQTVDAARIGDRIMTVDMTMGAHTVNIGNQAIIVRSVATGYQADGSTMIGNLIGNDATTTTRGFAATYTFNAGSGVNLSAQYLDNTKKFDAGSTANASFENTSKTGNGIGFKIDYAAGPLTASASTLKRTTNNALTATAITSATAQLLVPVGTFAAVDANKRTNIETTMNVAGVSYDFKPVRVYAQYASVENKNTYTDNNTTLGNSKRNATSIGARYAIGDSFLFAQVSTGKNQITGTATVAPIDGDWKGQNFGYKHAFSKRTLGYVMTGSSEFGASATTKSKVEQTAFGLMHTF